MSPAHPIEQLSAPHPSVKLEQLVAPVQLTLHGPDPHCTPPLLQVPSPEHSTWQAQAAGQTTGALEQAPRPVQSMRHTPPSQLAH